MLAPNKKPPALVAGARRRNGIRDDRPVVPSLSLASNHMGEAGANSLRAGQAVLAAPKVCAVLPKEQRIKISLAGATETGPTPFQPCLRLPTQPIQSRQFGLECFDRFDSTVRPFSLNRPIVGGLCYEEDRFTHNFPSVRWRWQPLRCAWSKSRRPCQTLRDAAKGFPGGGCAKY